MLTGWKFLCIALIGSYGSVRAQCDSLNRKLFEQVSVCDSVTISQSNEIVRLRGEIEVRNTMLVEMIKTGEMKDTLLTRHEKFLQQDFAEQKKEASFVVRILTGALIFITIIAIVK